MDSNEKLLGRSTKSFFNRLSYPFLELISRSLNDGPPKLFTSSSIYHMDLRKLRFQLQSILSTWETNGVDEGIAVGSMKIYDALVYKFGRSNRHQKFWKVTLQVYSELKRINRRNLKESLANISTVCLGIIIFYKTF